jgi:hypothetical protein
MTRSFYILVIALLMSAPQNAYSQFTDSLIREVNYRLWQGAKAREQVIQLKKELAIDSALIHEQGVVIEKLDKENIQLRTDNAILTQTTKQYKRISGALTLLVVLLIL